MKKLRKLIFWTHLICGVLAGIFIFIMCVTGAILSFESNILAFVESDQRFVNTPDENAARLSLNEIITKLQVAKPAAKPAGITLQNNRNAAAVISLGRDGQVFVNPYTGEITGEGAKNWRGFFRFVEDGHRWLSLTGSGRDVGITINYSANLLFLFLAISGVYIWFPRKFSWKTFKAVLWFRRGLRGKARDFNWHNTIGFWTSLCLIIITLTAVIISYSWANNLLYAMTGNEVPNQQPRQTMNIPEGNQPILPENIEELWGKAENQTGWKAISLRFPINNDAVVFSIDEGIYWNKFGRSNLTVDAKTAEVIKWESYGAQNSARQIRSWVRFTHTGESGGIIGQVVGFIACIGGAVLVWTGMSLALRRFQNRRRTHSTL